MRERPHADRSRTKKPIHLRDTKSKILILLSIAVSNVSWTLVAFSALSFCYMLLYFVDKHNLCLFPSCVCVYVYVIPVGFVLCNQGIPGQICIHNHL